MSAPKLTLTPAELALARDWIMDCQWEDIDTAADLDAFTDAQIERGITRHFSGGISAFKQSCDNFVAVQ